MGDPPFAAVLVSTPSCCTKSTRAEFKTYSFIADSLRRNRVHKGPSSSLGVSLTSLLGPTPFSMTAKISCAFSECMMTVVTPAAVANSAAMSFVDMPPVPSDVPRVAVDTASSVSLLDQSTITAEWSVARRTLSFDLFDIAHHSHRSCIGITPWIIGIQALDIGEQEEVVGMHDCRRDGREGIVIAKLDFLNPSVSAFGHDSKRDRLTETETVSFSLTIGTTPMDSSSENVFCALRYRVRCRGSISLSGFSRMMREACELTSEISIRVRRICAMG